MLNAQEALAITINVTHAKIEKGKEKARRAIPTIEACILRAANIGAEYTVIYPLRIDAINSAEEQSGYISELTTILTEAQYKVDYNVSAESMRIGWAQ